jgi:hypothetical protein
MPRLKAAFSGGVMVLAGVLTGCATDQPGGSHIARTGSANVSTVRLPGVSVEQVAPVARRVFRQSFSIDSEASLPNLWVSRPTEVGQERPVGVRGALSGARLRHRQIAELQLLPERDSVLVRVQVRLERLETAERQAFARPDGDDRPTDTPIDRIGPSDTGGREDWLPAGRDRKAEQELLSEIEAELVATRPA